MPLSIALVPLLTLPAGCDKGSDSGAATESDADTDADADTDSDSDSDADTDSDSDADSDTDTDSDSDTDTRPDVFTASIEVTVTVTKTADTVCDTTIQLTGTPYAGTCPDCDLAYDVTGTIADEAGSGCDPSYMTSYATYLADAKVPEVWLAFSGMGVVYDTKDATNILWRGTDPKSLGYVDWYPNVFDGSIFGAATYAEGVLDWTLDYDGALASGEPTRVYARGTATIP